MTALIIVAFCATVAGQALGTAETKRIEEAAAVLNEIRQTPDKDIPQSLWDKARCVAVIPSLKRVAFVVGGEYGKGLLSCRTAGGWSAPVFIKMAKGTWGAQIGGEAVDLILLVMNDRGVDHLLQDKVTLGTEASVAAGPLGRDAQAATDAQMHAEILSWSRSRGVFAGISLAGGVLSADPDDNRDLYGAPVNPREILMKPAAKVPPPAAPFLAALKHHDAPPAKAAHRAEEQVPGSEYAKQAAIHYFRKMSLGILTWTPTFWSTSCVIVTFPATLVS
jgi:lipid-binding SYLF domain-containing protein